VLGLWVAIKKEIMAFLQYTDLKNKFNPQIGMKTKALIILGLKAIIVYLWVIVVILQIIVLRLVLAQQLADSTIQINIIDFCLITTQMLTRMAPLSFKITLFCLLH
jgi:hypothetical protein